MKRILGVHLTDISTEAVAHRPSTPNVFELIQSTLLRGHCRDQSQLSVLERYPAYRESR